MNVVLVGEEGRKALPSIPPGAVIHAVGWYPEPGETSRAVVCHTRKEHELAEIIAADKVIGGDPAVWNLPVPQPVEPPKRRGRPPKVK